MDGTGLMRYRDGETVCATYAEAGIEIPIYDVYGGGSPGGEEGRGGVLPG